MLRELVVWLLNYHLKHYRLLWECKLIAISLGLAVLKIVYNLQGNCCRRFAKKWNEAAIFDLCHLGRYQFVADHIFLSPKEWMSGWSFHCTSVGGLYLELLKHFGIQHLVFGD